MLLQVPDWRTVKSNRGSGPARHSLLSDHTLSHDRSSPKTSKVNKAKGQTSGRTYTSKYRGVHQTFPTKRWEAQFRSVPSFTHLRRMLVATVLQKSASSKGH